MVCFGLFAALAIVAGCSDADGPAATDTIYALTCPAAPTECGSLSEDTCLRPDGGAIGDRDIFGENGELGCDGENVTIVVCRATETESGRQMIDLEASVGGFGFETRIFASIDGATIDGTCEVTVLEDDLAYGGALGTCGIEPPSMEQPCQISNISIGDDESIDVSFDVLCEGLRSETVPTDGFDVQANIRFARCTGI